MGRPGRAWCIPAGVAVWLGVIGTAWLRGAGAGAAATPSGGNDTAPLRVAFSSSMFVDVNENDAGAAVRAWAQMLGRDHGIPADPAAKTLRGTEEIAAAVKGNLVDAITMTTEEYWLLRGEFFFDHFVFGIRGGRVTEEYVLLVRRDSGIERIADLRAHSLAVYQNPRASLAPVWLETLLAEAHLGRPADLCGRVTFPSKLSRVILPVFFRQTDACLVTRAGFETMSELNPQVGRQLKVLASSPELVPSFFCFRGNYASPFRDQVLAHVGVINSTAAGQQFMTLFQCESLEERPVSCLQSAIDLLETHRRLCGPTNGVAAEAQTAVPSPGKGAN